MRRPQWAAALILPAAWALCAAGPALAEGSGFPDRAWQAPATLPAAWSPTKLAAAEAFALSLRPTAVMVVQDGQVVAAWGDVARKVNVRSVRKSLLSSLYGIGVGEGRIDVSRTLASLGIDDKEPRLTEGEKKATIRDLLMARSGVYHEAAYEPSSMAARRPERGSHRPGEFWYYNNWDFNALGTIYARLMGETVFEGFERRIAKPIGMEDFTASDGRFRLEASSEHPAYLMRLSARDLARFGLLYLNRGRWKDERIVPEPWVAESTRRWSEADQRRGYGYLWWRPPGDAIPDPNAFYAAGNGGQFVAVIPSRRLVVVKTVEHPNGRRTGTRPFLDLLGRILAANQAEPR
jgi:CubicO group peptidase (beta-lactamase class C family)